MNCRVNFKDLSRYIDGACTQEEKERIELHLKECQECKQTLARLNLLKASLSSIAPVKESESFDFVFNQKLKERSEERVSVSLNEVLGKAISRIRDAFVPKVPVLVRAVVVLVLAVAVFGGYNYYIYSRLPFIETISGTVKVYRTPAARYIIARPNMRLREGYRIETAQDAVVDILSRNKYAARIKEDSDIVIAKLDVRKGNHFTKFDITSGKLMVNTTEAFKGSNMSIQTLACEAKVVGTAFTIDVYKPSGGATWLGVLQGKVKVTSQGADVYVNAGQKTQVEPGSLPDIPTLLSDNEWKLMQELYQLGEKPQVVLLVSMRANRVEELLKPAPLYISDTTPRTIPTELEAIIRIINRAIEDNDIEAHRFAIGRLERLLKKHPNPKYNPQFLMFIGSYCYYIGNYEKAIDTFNKVVNEYPDYSLSSLAQCAIATIYQNNLRDKKKATAGFEELLENFPDSIDTVRARKFFKNLKK